MASVLTKTFKEEGKRSAQELLLKEFSKHGDLQSTAAALGLHPSTITYWLLKLNMRLVTVLMLDDELNLVETVYMPAEPPAKEVAVVG